MNDLQNFQRIFLTPADDIDSTVTFFSQTTTFEEFLKFVSENFSATRSNISYEVNLFCKQCENNDRYGLIAEFGSGLQPGEKPMMAAIGKHLDEVEHSFPQVPHTWKEVNLMHPEIEALEEISPQDFKTWVYALPEREDQRTVQMVAVGLLMDDEDMTPGKMRAVIKYAFEKAQKK